MKISAEMSIEIKNVLISDQLDKKVVELLNKANMNVQVNTSLNSQKLISEIKVSGHIRQCSNYLKTAILSNFLHRTTMRCSFDPAPK